MRKGLWSPDEDEKLRKCIATRMSGSWSDVARNAGLQRCGKSCRRRWMNHLRPDLKRGKFTQDEIRLVIKLHQGFGNKWSEIAAHLVGRTDNDVKNLWNTQIKRQLRPQEISDNEVIKNELISCKNSRADFPFSLEDITDVEKLQQSPHYSSISSPTSTNTTTNDQSWPLITSSGSSNGRLIKSAPQLTALNERLNPVYYDCSHEGIRNASVEPPGTMFELQMQQILQEYGMIYDHDAAETHLDLQHMDDFAKAMMMEQHSTATYHASEGSTGDDTSYTYSAGEPPYLEHNLYPITTQVLEDDDVDVDDDDDDDNGVDHSIINNNDDGNLPRGRGWSFDISPWYDWHLETFIGPMWS